MACYIGTLLSKYHEEAPQEIAEQNGQIAQQINDSTALKIVESLIKDIRDRSGLKHEWNAIDDDVKEEIRSSWKNIVQQHH
jgi:hypothetical protein